MIQSKIVFAALTVLIAISSIFVFRHIDEGHDAEIRQEIEKLYREREAIDSNLRSQIVDLQKKVVNLPKIFSKNKRAVLVDMIQADFKIEETQKITEKEVINQLFSREERKELFAGRVVVQTVNNQLFYAVVLTDDSGQDSGVVERSLLQSKNVRADFDKLNAIVNADLSEETGKVNYEEKISLLKQICINAAFESEKTRIEFVSSERDIAIINNIFVKATQNLKQKRQQIILAIFGGNIFLTIILVIVLFRSTYHRKDS